MTKTITVRYRTHGELPYPPFSARNFRDLSGGAAVAAVPPPGFTDAVLPAQGATLAQTVYLSGLFAPPALCSGIGRCGLCRVRFLSDPPPALDTEERILSHHDIDAGWRLACRHAPVPGAHVLVPALSADVSLPVLPTECADLAPCQEEGGVPSMRNLGRKPGRYALAVDLGTTSIHWRLVSLEGNAGPGLPHGVMTNPQMGAGSDVISRLAYAAREGGAYTLSRLATDALGGVIHSCATAGYVVEEICIAANPAMTAILLERETTSLARAPYSLPLRGNTVEKLGNLPPVYIPPMISPFVGADVSAGHAALAMDPALAAPEYPFLLADMGTNGECVLALSPSEALAASLPMGPALEGVNLAYGSEAVRGAVTDFTLTPYGLEPVVMGETAPIGITATGYLSLLRILRASGVIGEDGLFILGNGAPLAAKVGGGEAAVESFGDGRERSIRLPGKMLLYASDIEEILKVKASFTLAVSRLLGEASLPAAKLARVCLAGSLGANVSLAALSSLGFLPPGTVGKVFLAGNTSLAGAALFLQNNAVREKCARWAEAVATLDLAADPAFADAFARHMAFSWRS